MKNSKIRKTLISSIICNTLVWYDYVAFGKLADVFSKLFFPYSDKYVALIATFSIFASGFLMRPIGASIFGYIGDYYGRKVALLFSIVLMSAPVAFISIMPTYTSVGIAAPIFLLIARLIQGFALGGESGNATFLIEHSKDGKDMGLFGSLEVFSAVLGSVISLLVIHSCKLLTGENFLEWGWRIPFIVGLVIGLISCYIRHTSNESPAYEANKVNDNLSNNPLKDLLKNHKKKLLVSIGIDCVENSAFYMFTVFFSIFVTEISGTFLNSNIFIETLAILLVAILTVIFAALSDIIGRKKVMIPAFIGLFIVSLPTLWLLTYNNIFYMMIAHIIFAIPFAASLGPSSAAISELFPTKIRYTGFALSRNIAAALSGGLAPAACIWIIKSTGLIISPGFYMMFWSIIGLVAFSQVKITDKNIDW